MTSYAITVVGHDRPGIIADVTTALSQHGANVEDSTMTLLRGHFSWMLVIGADADINEIDASLAPVRKPGLAISVLPVVDEADIGSLTVKPYLVTVHGADRTGIVASITTTIAAVGGNITDLTTRLSGGLYVVAAEVDLPVDADTDRLAAQLELVAAELAVTAHLRPNDADVM